MKKLKKPLLLTAILVFVAAVFAFVTVNLAPSSLADDGAQPSAAHVEVFYGSATHDAAREFKVNLDADGNPVATTISAGSYYLTADVSVSTITVKGTVNLCLNGHAITGNGSKSVITVGNNATLNLYDCKDGGKITGGASANGGGINVNSYGALNMYGGEISGNNAVGSGDDVYGGGVYVSENSTFNMYGGAVKNNTSAQRGGGVAVKGAFVMWDGEISGNNVTVDSKNYGGGGVYVHGAGSGSATSFTLHGGLISNNTSNGVGGGISVGGDSGKSNATINITGGTISGNSAKEGGGINVKGTFNISGNPVISDNTDTTGKPSNVKLTSAAKGQTILVIGELKEGAYVGVTPIKDGTLDSSVVVQVTDYDLVKKDYFFLDSEDTYEAKVKIGAGEEAYYEDFVTAWTAATDAAEPAKLTLLKDVEIEDELTVGNELTLNLNGRVLKYTNEFCAVCVDGNLTLDDVSQKQNVITLKDGSAVTLTGGVVTGGCGVIVSYEASFTMNGGNISGNSNDKGGGVCVDGSFTMNGGTVSYNEAESQGGGIYVDGNSGKFIMNGGTVTGNSAVGTNGAGGGVFVASDSGKFTMTGGKVTANGATRWGGGVYLGNNSYLNLSGAIVISGNFIDSAEGKVVNNLSIDSESNVIKVIGKLESGTDKANIGVTIRNEYDCGPITSGYGENNKDAGGGIAAPNNYFFADEGGCVQLSLSESEVIIAAHDDNTEKITDEVAATCTTPGHKKVTCAQCGAVFEDIVYPALGHDYDVENAVWKWDNPKVFDSSKETPAVSVTLDCRSSSHTATITYGEEDNQYGIIEFVKSEETAATCLQAQTYKYTFRVILYDTLETVPDEVFEVTKGNKKSHGGTAHAAKDATCTEDGNVAYWECLQGCGKLYGDSGYKTVIENVVIPATGHDYDFDNPVWNWDWDLTVQEGYRISVTLKCNNDISHTETVTETAGVYGKIELTESSSAGVTCTQPETYAYSFKLTLHVNGGADREYTKEYSETNGEALGHSKERHAAVAATCASAGNVEYWHCTRCNKNYGEEACETELENVVIAATGNHNYNWVIDDATCEETGLKTGTCNVCNAVSTEIIPAKGHSGVRHERVEATCVANGNIEYWQCSREGCGKYFNKAACAADDEIQQSDTVIISTGHEYGAPVWSWNENANPITATAAFTCSKCTESTDGHTRTENAAVTQTGRVEASCTTDGSITYRADVNYGGTPYSDTHSVTINALGHDWNTNSADVVWGSWTEKDGGWTVTAHLVCKRDEDHLQDLAVTVTSVTDNATCESAGRTVYSAAVMDGETVRYTCPVNKTVTIPAKGHDWAAGFTVDVAPTCTQTGSKSIHCSRCGEKKEVTAISALGHDLRISVNADALNRDYSAFDTVDLSGLIITADCSRECGEDGHTVTFTGGTDTEDGITYESGDCLHFGDEKVSVSVPLRGYGTDGSYAYEMAVTVQKREVAAEWEYLDGSDWKTLENGAVFTYDGASHTVSVKFAAHSNDGGNGDANFRDGHYMIDVGAFKNADGYSYSISGYGDNYVFTDTSRSVTVNKKTVEAGDAHWVSANASLMDGYVKAETADGATVYKYYPSETEGVEFVKNAVVRFKDGTVTVSYPAGEFYTVEYAAGSQTTAAASGKYTATAILKLKDGENYAFTPMGGAALNSDGTLTLPVKEWYAAVADNGFIDNNNFEGWTFGQNVAITLPELEKDDFKDETVLLTLSLGEKEIGSFNRGRFADYVNNTMPAGTYKLVATVGQVVLNGTTYGGFTQEFSFTVKKAALTVDNESDLKGKTFTYSYDGTVRVKQDFVPQVTLVTEIKGVWSGEEYKAYYGNVEITYSHEKWNGAYFTVEEISERPERYFINAGEYTATYKVSAPNYTDCTGTFGVKINKAVYEFNISFDGGEVVYDGQPHSIFVSGLPEEITVSYEGNGKINANEDGYTVTAKFKGDDVNYEPIADLTAKLIIHKASYSLDLTFNGDEVIYNGEPHSIFVSGDVPAGVTVSYDGNDRVNANEAGYTVTAKFTLTDSINYNGIPDMTAKLIIRKAEITLTGISFEDKTHTYNHETQVLEISGTLPETVEVRYENNRGMNARVYEAKAVLAVKEIYAENYKFAAGVKTEYNATLTILQAAYDMSGVTFEGKTVTYTGSAYSLSISGNLPYGVSYSYENNSNVKAGRHEVTVKFTGDSVNYKAVSDMSATLIIEKADYDMSGVTFTDATVSYTGNAHSLSVRGKIPAGVTYSYENNSNTAAGSYVVTVKFKGDSDNYNPIDDMQATLRIAPASYRVENLSLAGSTLIYDGDTHSLSVSGTLPEGVSVKYYVNDKEFTGAKDAGVYTVTAVFTGNANYKVIRPLTATLTIVAPEKPGEEIPEIKEPEVSVIETSPIISVDQNAVPVISESTAQSTDYLVWLLCSVVAVEVAAIAVISAYIAIDSRKNKKW